MTNSTSSRQILGGRNKLPWYQYVTCRFCNASAVVTAFVLIILGVHTISVEIFILSLLPQLARVSSRSTATLSHGVNWSSSSSSHPYRNEESLAFAHPVAAADAVARAAAASSASAYVGGSLSWRDSLSSDPALAALLLSSQSMVHSPSSYGGAVPVFSSPLRAEEKAETDAATSDRAESPLGGSSVLKDILQCFICFGMNA